MSVKNLVAGNKVKFLYVKPVIDTKPFPFRYTLEVSEYEGVVEKVRSIDNDPLDPKTIARNSILRSDYLLTVRTTNGRFVSCYDGRIVDLQKINKNFLGRLVEKLTGK
jgi:hypothetical protein